MFYAKIPDDMKDDLTNRFLDRHKRMTEDQKVVMDTQWEWYRKECGLEPMIPYHVFVVLMWEVYVKSE
jgi:hypothetical protein